ncbi:MAG TPA: exodeoxyribonuclease VII large subunit [Clostridiales bacterium]|nr:exodeoxyribonuclease VII large subunit [Clostridiales bacterium]
MIQERILRVGEVNAYVKALLDTDPILHDVYIKGEISNFTNHYKTGHFYFTLKDEEGSLKAVMFKSSASKLKFLPENGMKVIARGRISAFVRDGAYQLYTADMEPDGIGALYIAFEQLKEKLQKEGLFDPEHKKRLPAYPHRVGIITSPTGAAVRDIINVSNRRWPAAELILFPALVQGENAPAQLCRGVRYFNVSCQVDVIILGRGGGSLEELWAFNDETLARTIFASRVPIISAVGHETDFSISDFVSDMRAPTPSAAAELALPDRTQSKDGILRTGMRMTASLQSRLHTLRVKVDTDAKKRCLVAPTAPIDDRRMLLSHLETRLERASSLLLERNRAVLGLRAQDLKNLNPLAVIARGYSAVFDQSGHVVKSVKQVKPGDTVTFRTVDGGVVASVQKTYESNIREEIK